MASAAPVFGRPLHTEGQGSEEDSSGVIISSLLRKAAERAPQFPLELFLPHLQKDIFVY